jgi:hypothetical protein
VNELSDGRWALSPFNGPSTFLPVSHPTEGPHVNDCLHSFYRPAPRMAPGKAATWNGPGLFGPCYSAFRIVGSIGMTKASLRDVRDRLLVSTSRLIFIFAGMPSRPRSCVRDPAGTNLYDSVPRASTTIYERYGSTALCHYYQEGRTH